MECASVRKPKDFKNIAVKGLFVKIPLSLVRDTTLSLESLSFFLKFMSNYDGWKTKIKNTKKRYVSSVCVAELKQAGYLTAINLSKNGRRKDIIYVGTYNPWNFNFKEVISYYKGEGVCLTMQKETVKEILSHIAEVLAEENPNARIDIPEINISTESGLSFKLQDVIFMIGDITNQATKVYPIPANPSVLKRTIKPAKEKSEKDIQKEKNKAVSLQLAERLADIILSKTGVKTPRNKIKTWVAPINYLVTEELQGNSLLVKKVLSWYEKQDPKAEFAFVVESGAALKNKFIRMKTAMERKPAKGFVAHTNGSKGSSLDRADKPDYSGGMVDISKKGEF
jgi:hypothetical protein